MLVKALTSFAGVISMGVGEVREIVDKEIAKDLIKAGHVVEVKAEKAKKEVEAAKAAEEAVENTVEKSEAKEEEPVEKSTKKSK